MNDDSRNELRAEAMNALATYRIHHNGQRKNIKARTIFGAVCTWRLEQLNAKRKKGVPIGQEELEALEPDRVDRIAAPKGE